MADELNIARARLGANEAGRNESPIKFLIRLSEYFHTSTDAMVKADLCLLQVIMLLENLQNQQMISSTESLLGEIIRDNSVINLNCPLR